MISVISAFAPSRPYDPENGKVNLETKICRHIRRKGWKFCREKDQWKDPKAGTYHSFTAAIAIQLHREEKKS